MSDERQGLWRFQGLPPKYTVRRLDGSIPAWPSFVLGARDPAAAVALRAYADAATRLNYPPAVARDALTLADQFDAYRATHGASSPDPAPDPNQLLAALSLGMAGAAPLPPPPPGFAFAPTLPQGATVPAVMIPQPSPPPPPLPPPFRPTAAELARLPDPPLAPADVLARLVWFRVDAEVWLDEDGAPLAKGEPPGLAWNAVPPTAFVYEAQTGRYFDKRQRLLATLPDAKRQVVLPV